MRQRTLAVGLLVAFTASTWSPGVRAAEPAPELQIQVVQGLFRDVPPGLVKVLGGPLKQLISKQTGLGGDVALAPDALTLADRLKANQCQLGVFHGYEFAWAKARNPNLVPLVVTVYPSGKPCACVVVHKDCPAKTLGDLKVDAIAIPRGTKGHCFAYLARASGAETTDSQDKTPPSIEDALNAVVNGSSPAVLVDIGAVEGYEKLQPNAAKNLKILARSEPFPQNVIAYNKGTISEQAAAQLRQVLTTAHTTPAGKPLMVLWSITSFSDIPPDYEKDLKAIAQQYPAPGKPTNPSTVPGVGMTP